MNPLGLHEFHAARGVQFIAINGQEVVRHYGHAQTEHAALYAAAAVADLGFRSRLCVLGSDRKKFLHGQVTNHITALQPGHGCHAALVNNKGRMQGDLNVYCLLEELLLDFEPGYTEAVTRRLEKYIVADDVQVVDVAPAYGLLSVQGPRAAEALMRSGLGLELPLQPFQFAQGTPADLGDVFLVNQPRLAGAGFDLFVPLAGVQAAAERLEAAATALEGGWCGWDAWEMARIEAGLPRYGQDMDESTLPPEAGLDARAVSYNKGCYIGQEILNRIRVHGQVTRHLRGLLFLDPLASLPERGTPLTRDGKTVGLVTSAVNSWRFQRCIGLGYVRREITDPGIVLNCATAVGDMPVRVVPLPFQLPDLAAAANR